MRKKSKATNVVIKRLMDLSDGSYLSVRAIAEILLKEDGWNRNEDLTDDDWLGVGQSTYRRYMAKARSLMERLMDDSDTFFMKEKAGDNNVYTLNDEGKYYQKHGFRKGYHERKLPA